MHSKLPNVSHVHSSTGTVSFHSTTRRSRLFVELAACPSSVVEIPERSAREAKAACVVGMKRGERTDGKTTMLPIKLSLALGATNTKKKAC